MPRLAFMGTPEFAAASLRALLNAGYTPVAVYTQPPRPANRGQKLQPSPVHVLANDAGIAVHHPTSLRDPLAQSEFAALNLDLAIVAAYGLLLPAPILTAPRLGCINIHASLLPRWRGAAPIQRAILAGDQESGIGLMQMEIGLDTGPVLAEARCAITPTTTGGALHDQLAILGADLLIQSLPKILAGALPAKPQPIDGVTYAQKIIKDEARIDWTQPAAMIERHIRAFAPSPGAYFEHQSERIKIFAASIAAPQALAPGQITLNPLRIGCGTGVLLPSMLQRPGKKPQTVDEFLRGFSFG